MSTKPNLQEIYTNALYIVVTQQPDRFRYDDNLKTIKYLIEKGANPFAKLQDKHESIMLSAIRCRTVDVLEILFETKHKQEYVNIFAEILRTMCGNSYERYLRHIHKIISQISPDEFVANFGECFIPIIKVDGSQVPNIYGEYIAQLLETASHKSDYHSIVKFIILSIPVTDSVKICIMSNFIKNTSLDMIRYMGENSDIYKKFPRELFEFAACTNNIYLLEEIDNLIKSTTGKN